MTMTSTTGEARGADDGREPTPLEWLESATDIARAEILTAYTRTSCIVSSYIGQKVLHRFGLQTAPEPVILRAYTSDFWQDMKAGVPMEQRRGWSLGIEGTDKILSPADCAARRAAAGLPGLDASAKLGGWDGHLALRADGQDGDLSLLIDMSADQLDRPQRGLRVTRPVVALLPEEMAPQWAAGEGACGVKLRNGAVILTYEQAPQMVNWTRSRVWDGQDPDAQDMIERCVRRITEEIGAAPTA